MISSSFADRTSAFNRRSRFSSGVFNRQQAELWNGKATGEIDKRIQTFATSESIDCSGRKQAGLGTSSRSFEKRRKNICNTKWLFLLWNFRYGWREHLHNFSRGRTTNTRREQESIHLEPKAIVHKTVFQMSILFPNSITQKQQQRSMLYWYHELYIRTHISVEGKTRLMQKWCCDIMFNFVS